jgi:hypothetical protein
MEPAPNRLRSKRLSVDHFFKLQHIGSRWSRSVIAAHECDDRCYHFRVAPPRTRVKTQIQECIGAQLGGYQGLEMIVIAVLKPAELGQFPPSEFGRLLNAEMLEQLISRAFIR